MKNIYGFMALIGLALTPLALLSQAPATAPAATAPPAAASDAAAFATIPPDQQATPEQFEKLFDVLRVRDQFQSFMKMMPSMVQQQIKSHAKQAQERLPSGQQLTPEQLAAIGKMTDKYIDKALNIYPIDEMIADIIPIYQRHISRADVDAIIAFYSSPAGQRMLALQPVIMKELMPVVMSHVQERTSALTDQMTKEMDAYMKSITPPATAPAAK